MQGVVTITDELHAVRAKADSLGMKEASERLRVAIVEAALKLGVPTGPRVPDLLKGQEYSSPSAHSAK